MLGACSYTIFEEHKQHGAGGRDTTILQSVEHARTKKKCGTFFQMSQSRCTL